MATTWPDFTEGRFASTFSPLNASTTVLSADSRNTVFPVAALVRFSKEMKAKSWRGCALAQDTPVLLLAEPTTLLDIAHQLEVLRLCWRLHLTGNYTLVTVLHDLSLAFRFADHVIAVKAGRIVAEGPPSRIATPDIMREVYGIESVVITDPATGGPLVVPLEPDGEHPASPSLKRHLMGKLNTASSPSCTWPQMLLP